MKSQFNLNISVKPYISAFNIILFAGCFRSFSLVRFPPSVLLEPCNLLVMRLLLFNEVRIGCATFNRKETRVYFSNVETIDEPKKILEEKPEEPQQDNTMFWVVVIGIFMLLYIIFNTL